MDEKKKLSLGMGILFLFVFVFFGSIIINEKNKSIMTFKVEKRFSEYIQDKYEDIYSTINIDKTIYNKKRKQYEVKVKNKENQHLYFIVSYKNKKFSSTYKEDYIYGNSLLRYNEEQLRKKLTESKKYKNVSIQFTKKLNQYSHEIYDLLISDNEIYSLPIYDFSCDISVENFNTEEITKEINNLYQYIKNCDLNPKYLNVVITDKNDISYAVSIKKIDKDLINDQLPIIINDIINKDKNVEDKYGVTYQYMN